MNELESHPRIGIDLGGTKTEVIALQDDGRAILRHRVATPHDDYRAIIDAITELIEETEKQLGARASIGVGMPGSISPTTGLVRNANTTCLNGKPFDHDLARALGRSVRVDNDANCFTRSEAVDGAGRDARVVFGVILGTGVGGGVAIDGDVITGRNRVAGEWGHNPMPWMNEDEAPGSACYCGRRACIETFVSGPGLSRGHAERSGSALDAAAIVHAAAAGEPAARASLERFMDQLGRALAGVVNVLDPDVIVLGGGLSRATALYDTLPGLIGKHIFSDRAAVDLRPASHGDSSGVRGAAWLWPARDAP